MRRWFFALLFAIAPACQGSAPNALAGAVIGTALGLTASAVSRVNGGCYASCPTGTTCNEVTGLCEPLPCRGRCSRDEVCDTTSTVPQCVSRSQVPTPATRVQDTLPEGQANPPYLPPFGPLNPIPPPPN